MLAAALIACGAAARTETETLEVQVSGVDGELERNVRARLSIADLAERADASDDQRESRSKVDLTEARVRRLHADARPEIVTALRPFGYYDPSSRASLERDEEGWTARYEVMPGEPTHIANVDVRVRGAGRDIRAVREVLREDAIERGDVLRHREYERLKRRLFDAAYNAGYVDASYERAALRVRPNGHEADVQLVLDTGPRHYFGEIQVRQDALDPEFVDRYVPVEAGDPFNADRLVDLQAALGDSGYFEDVSVEVLRREAANHRIPVRISAEPRPNQEFTVGVGYGTDSGARLRFGTELRRLNRSGHRLKLDMRISSLERTAAGEYRIPVRNFGKEYVSYRGALGTEAIGDFDTRQLSLGGSWNDDWRGLQRRVYVRGRRERFEAPGTGSRRAHAVFPGLRLTHQQSDDAVFPRRGHAWTADVRGSPDALASTGFARLHVTGDLIRPLGERGRLLLRGELGAIRSDGFDRLVPSQRFFAGGDESVRGYAYDSLGPTNAEGATTGGRYLVSGSVELDYLLFGNYGAAVFFDAGNAADTAPPDLKRSVGVGLRWQSPVGMLRVDVAHPLDRADEDYRLHLSIGTSL